MQGLRDSVMSSRFLATLITNDDVVVEPRFEVLDSTLLPTLLLFGRGGTVLWVSHDLDLRLPSVVVTKSIEI